VGPVAGVDDEVAEQGAARSDVLCADLLVVAGLQLAAADLVAVASVASVALALQGASWIAEM
jgi:hypothetical protein